MDFHRGKSLESNTEFILRTKLSSCFTRILFDYFRTFKESNGWLEKFKHRHSVTFRILSAESAQVDSVTLEEWKRRLPTLLESYPETDVYNADEAGLFFKLLPDRSMVLSKDTYKGGKRSKERYTILLCANWSGTHKLKPLVIGKRKVLKILISIIFISL